MIDIPVVKAISLDLDDTLWPVWPAIERAEKALLNWLSEQAPMTAALYASVTALREIREQVANELMASQPLIRHNLSAIRKESIRMALTRAGDNPDLAEPAFDAFFKARNQVDFYDDALPALIALSKHYPLVSISNGNANLEVVGVSHFFQATISAGEFGFAKPDPRIFYAAAGALNVQPHEMLHIGDDASLDVLGALNANMQAVWLNRDEKLYPHEKKPTLEVGSLAQVCTLLT